MSPNESRWSYLKVAERIRQEILAGAYKAGKRLPGEPALATRFGVGRATIARALQVLEQSNLVFRVRGSGTYIQKEAALGTARLAIGYLVGGVEILRGQPAGIAMEAARHHLEADGHSMQLLIWRELREAGEPAATLRRMVRAGSLDGLIVSHHMNPPAIRALDDILPLVVQTSDCLPEGMLNAAVDFACGYFQAARHLLDLGHRRIGLLGGFAETNIGYRAWQSFRLALWSAGADPDCQPVRMRGYDASQYAAQAEALLRENPGLTAVMCIDDMAAEATIETARRLGRKVPRDLSVIGCNDFPSAAQCDPPLTTLHIDFAELGRRAVDLLLGRIFGRTTATRRYVQPQLIVRDSTAPPARRG